MGWTKPAAMHKIAFCGLAVSFVLSAGASPTQGKLEGWKTLQTLEINMDYFDYSGLVSPQRENTAAMKE